MSDPLVTVLLDQMPDLARIPCSLSGMNIEAPSIGTDCVTIGTVP